MGSCKTHWRSFPQPACRTWGVSVLWPWHPCLPPESSLLFQSISLNKSYYPNELTLYLDTCIHSGGVGEAIDGSFQSLEILVGTCGWCLSGQLGQY